MPIVFMDTRHIRIFLVMITKGVWIFFFPFFLFLIHSNEEQSCCRYALAQSSSAFSQTQEHNTGWIINEHKRIPNSLWHWPWWATPAELSAAAGDQENIMGWIGKVYSFWPDIGTIDSDNCGFIITERLFFGVVAQNKIITV